jgi:uncharacterized protein
MADALAAAVATMAAARPTVASAHVAASVALVAETAALYALEPSAAAALAAALERGDAAAEVHLSALGLTAPAAAPVDAGPEPVRALALTVSQTCNLACGYCYAGGGSFGGPDRRMDWDVARRAIDFLVDGAPPGSTVAIAFMGGEPMIARDLIRRAAPYARHRAAARATDVRFAMTTNGTLLTEADAAFLAEHRFAVTVSLDGDRATNDRLRPARGGAGSFDRVAAGLAPLLARADRIALSARVTVTPENLDLEATVATLGALGFASVGVAPMIASPTGRGALRGDDFVALLAAMMRCGDAWMAATLDGRHHPFANLATALGELHRGEARRHSCGAAREYLAVDASGALSACHRFVNDPLGGMGSLAGGVDEKARDDFLAARAVERQEPCARCWARRLCGGGCHHEVLHAGRPACDYVRGWLHYAMSAYGRLVAERPDWFDGRA